MNSSFRLLQTSQTQTRNQNLNPMVFALLHPVIIEAMIIITDFANHAFVAPGIERQSIQNITAIKEANSLTKDEHRQPMILIEQIIDEGDKEEGSFIFLES